MNLQFYWTLKLQSWEVDFYSSAELKSGDPVISSG